MTLKEMHELKYRHGKEFRIGRAIHLHDEDERNEYVLTYRGIIVGSELVDRQFVEENIEKAKLIA